LSKSFPLFIFIVAISTCIHAQSDSTKRTSFAIYPAFGYQPETKTQLGAVAIIVFEKPNQDELEFNRPTTFSPYFLYTLKNQVLTALDGNIYFKNGYNLSAKLRFFNFPDNYYGIGNENDPDDFEKYTNRFVQLESRLYKPLNQRTFVGLTIDFQNNSLTKFEPGGKLETQDINGKSGGLHLGIGPAFKYDSRDNTLFPSTGVLASAEILTVALGEYHYANFWIDLRKYTMISNEKNIIAFHFSSRFVAGSDVPFYKLPQLGGENRLRGIANASIYRDRNAMFFQTEYRRQLFWRFAAVAFAGIGDVAHKIGDFNVADLKYIGGLGFRFAAIKNQKLNIRFDYGLARGNQSAFYIGLEEAF